MNDDNCEFGFYVDSENKMPETIKYWLNFYKQKAFIRFTIIDKAIRAAVGNRAPEIPAIISRIITAHKAKK